MATPKSHSCARLWPATFAGAPATRESSRLCNTLRRVSTKRMTTPAPRWGRHHHARRQEPTGSPFIRPKKGNLVEKMKSIMAALSFAALAATPALAQETIRFGAPLALTGPLADAGTKSKQGYDICVTAVNAKGGVDVGGKKMKLELVEYDYQSETNRAVQIVQRLINVDKVPFLLAPYGSGDTKATAVVAERYGVPMVAAAAATKTVFDQKFQNLFGVLFPNNMITEAEVAYYTKKVPTAKRVAVLALNSLFPKAIAGDLVETAKAQGLEVVFNTIYSPDTSDFSNVLTQIKSLNPDWLYATGYTQDLILIRRQMADIGLDVKILTMTA